MLRRRIFSSAMASVMALSSIAVVANAEDTNKEYINKEDLKAYVDSLASFRDNDLYDYGSKSGEKFLDAIEYAENVINNAEYDEDDATVAYQMLKEVKARLVIYKAEDLQALINSCTADYERNNVLNEELSDAIYGETEFGVFEDKYEMALVDVESGDSRLITDTYEELKAAYDAMVASKLATVTKSDFTAAIKALEKAMMKEKTVSEWRQGSVDYWSNYLDAYIKADFNDNNKGAWWLGGSNVWGCCWIEMIDYLKGVVAAKDVYTNYDTLIDIKSTNETSNTAIVDACNAAKEVAATINGWKVDNTNRGSKANVAKLLDQYNGAIVYTFMNWKAEQLFSELYTVMTEAGGQIELNGRVNEFAKEEMTVTTTATPENLFVVDKTSGNNPMTIDATLKLRANKDFFLKLDANNKVTGFAMTEAEAGENKKKVSKGVKIDLLDYIYVDPAIPMNWGNYPGGTCEIENTVLNFGKLLKLIYEYQNKDYASSNDYFRTMVTIDEVTAGSEKGSTAEWTLIYRALQYCINTMFGAGEVEGNTKADLEKLIEKTYEIEARTSEAAIFADAIAAMVEVRQEANDWLKAANADKKYRDNITVINDKIADRMHDDLAKKYDALVADEAAFAYTYGEIYDYIAVVAEGLETNDIKDEKGKVAELLKATSYYLSIVKTPHEDLDDDAFTDERDFISYNRVLTAAGGHTISYKSEPVAVPANGDHAALKASYEMLKAAVEADKTPAYEKGDVNKDKKIDLKDALATLKAANGNGTVEIELGDMNGNGKIDLQDALAILKKANA